MILLKNIFYSSFYKGSTTSKSYKNHAITWSSLLIKNTQKSNIINSRSFFIEVNIMNFHGKKVHKHKQTKYPPGISKR